jgi:hypothetical protein
MKFLTAIACFAITTASFAQHAAAPDPREVAMSQSKEISKMLGLDEAATSKLNEAMINSAKETTDMTAECAKIQEKINAVYDRNMATVFPSMTPAQMEQYQAAKKEGRLNFGSCAVNGGSCATGAKAGDAKAGGCCAGGKAHSEAAPAGQPAPEKK